jgi:CRISPR-associated autoregulator DevR family
MARGKKNENEQNIEIFSLNKGDFEKNGYPFSGKRAVVVGIYYSFPSNQNASGSSGTIAISQKIIPWGEEAEPRVYISPFALKRRIRDYWSKIGQRVYVREDRNIEEGKNEEESKTEKKGMKELVNEYIDVDLFGYMKAEQSNNKKAKKTKENEEGNEEGKSKGTQTIRPGPITSWGAVSLEPVHSFVDFNTCIYHPNEKEGGSIFNRGISKEFYFTSFFINPDLISVVLTNSKQEGVDKNKVLEMKKERLKLFLEGMMYAMQKDTGGPRDKPSCVFLAVQIKDSAYGDFDKKLFKNIEVKGDKVKIKLELPLKEIYILHFDNDFVESPNVKESDFEKVVKEVVDSLLSIKG